MKFSLLVVTCCYLLFTMWLGASGTPVGNGGQGSVSPQDVHVVDMPSLVNEKTSLVSPALYIVAV